MKRFYTLFIITILAACASAHANDQPFDAWLVALKQEARSKGISDSILEQAFDGVTPDERVITLDRKQPEGTLTLEQYLGKTITPRRVAEGKQYVEEHAALLAQVEQKYGVPKEVIVALWGIETSYGKVTGNFSIIESLATLAYDGRRSEFFRGELISALTILEQDHIEVAELEGSWAGALGQCQFMPSTFLRYAVDGNGDGKRDVWNTQEDVFASMANYLSEIGWKKGEGVGVLVTHAPQLAEEEYDIKHTKTVAAWKKLGVKLPASAHGFNDHAEASLIRIGKDNDARFALVLNNYKVLLKWNRSRYFATAVSTLATEIK